MLIVSHEALGAKMSGPAIRYWQLACALAKKHSVCLAVPDDPALERKGLEVMGYQRAGGHSLSRLAADADAIIVAGFLLRRYPFLKETGKPLIVDLYDPFILENLEIHKTKPVDTQMETHTVNLSVLNEQLRLGDFFLCAHEAQRDFWLGMLAANNRINPCTLADDCTLRRLIDVVPFGLPEDPPQHRRQVLKGVTPGIDTEDKVVYWGGGMWEWFDPLTAIHAIVQAAEVHSDLRLFFAGTRHPNPDVPPMRMCEAARQLSDDLGVTDQLVFFNEWVPYEERANYLLEADIGISLHFEHVETRLSFRTRLLDYIWAGLPMVVTSGDTLSELVAERQLGLTVEPGDVAGVRDALLSLLEESDLRRDATSRFSGVQSDFTWERVAEPLMTFCDEPYRAADRSCLSPPDGGERLGQPALLVRMWRTWREEGIRGVLEAVRSYLYWAFGGR